MRMCKMCFFWSYSDLLHKNSKKQLCKAQCGLKVLEKIFLDSINALLAVYACAGKTSHSVPLSTRRI